MDDKKIICFGCHCELTEADRVCGTIPLCDKCRDIARIIYQEYLNNKRQEVQNG